MDIGETVKVFDADGKVSLGTVRAEVTGGMSVWVGDIPYYKWDGLIASGWKGVDDPRRIERLSEQERELFG